MSDKDLAQQIIQYYQNRPHNFSQNYYYQIYVQSLLDPDIISKLHKSFSYYESGADIVDVIRILLSVMPYKNEDTLFLVICGVEIFKAITLGDKKKTLITYRDFLNHITDVRFQIRIIFQVQVIKKTKSCNRGTFLSEKFSTQAKTGFD